MSILDYLDTLRRKPRHVRERIALATTLSLFLLIASVWWSAFNESGTKKSAPKIAETPSPWSVTFNTLTDARDMAVTATKSVLSELESLAGTGVAAVAGSEKETAQ